MAKAALKEKTPAARSRGRKSSLKQGTPVEATPTPRIPTSGDTLMTFGKYCLQGKTFQQVIAEDLKYVRWVLEQDSGNERMMEAQNIFQELLGITKPLPPPREAQTAPPREEKKKKNRLDFECKHCGHNEFNVRRESGLGFTILCTQCATAEFFSLSPDKQTVISRFDDVNDFPLF